MYRKLKNLQAVFSFFRLNKGKTGDYYESQENNNLLLLKKMRYTDVYDKQSSLELKIYFDTDETPGNVSVQAGAEIIINQQLS